MGVTEAHDPDLCSQLSWETYQRRLIEIVSSGHIVHQHIIAQQFEGYGQGSHDAISGDHAKAKQ